MNAYAFDAVVVDIIEMTKFTFHSIIWFMGSHRTLYSLLIFVSFNFIGDAQELKTNRTPKSFLLDGSVEHVGKTREERIEFLSQPIIRLESELKNPQIKPQIRATKERLLADAKSTLLKYQADAIRLIPGTNSVHDLRPRAGFPGPEDEAKINTDTVPHIASPILSVPPRVRTREEMIEAISKSITQIESQLNNPELRPQVSERLQAILAKQKNYLLKYKTNALFGANHDTNLENGLRPRLGVSVSLNDTRPMPDGLDKMTTPERSVPQVEKPLNTSSLPTNADNISLMLSQSVSRYEQELKDPNLNSALRQSYETMLGQLRKQLADHNTNVQLWDNLKQARTPSDVKQREQELADYLAAKINKPSGMSLTAVMDEYKSKSGKMDRRKIVMAMLLTISALPLICYSVYRLRKHRVHRQS